MQQYRAVVVRDSSRHLPPLTRRIFDKRTVLRVATLQHKIDARRMAWELVFYLGIVFRNNWIAMIW
ncbi:hypothetical protein SAMN05216419_103021 [Nitrosomonas cryotolerans]|uniref:hypothetical protein n=1 Tax=Nitrosomonas cryotolerans TaxID=44575 RepID=UPI0004915387|nr:hypothetical protein [Nitrosomonas cryotolerans]SFP90054.1 hypothetical protein SAMN05216419_103021 [Nitrosomonas cryotolerans]